MSKRFTDTTIWQKSWYRRLPLKIKLFWKYLSDACDMIGIWEEDFEAASFYIGETVSESDFTSYPELFEGRIQRLGDNKWWLSTFVHFQYGELRENNNLHKTVVKKLRENKLLDIVIQGQGGGMAGDGKGYVVPLGIGIGNGIGNGNNRRETKDKFLAAKCLSETITKYPKLSTAQVDGLLSQWLDHRRRLKKPYTSEHGIKHLLDRLNNFKDPADALKWSLGHDHWTDVYERSDGNGQPKPTNGQKEESALEKRYRLEMEAKSREK